MAPAGASLPCGMLARVGSSIWRWLSWIGKIAATAYMGPGVVVIGDPGLDPLPVDASAPRWVTRSAVLSPIVALVLIMFSVAWPLVAGVAVMLLLPLVLRRIQAARRRASHAMRGGAKAP